MSSQFVFVHGWGTAPGFWDDLIGHLPHIKARCVDLGFVGGQQEFLNDISEPSIYVTHSLGTMWALKHRHGDMKALIAINGFPCFKNFADERALRAMKLRLVREPEAQMKDFWEMCGLPFRGDLNIEYLKEGLAWLSSWDMSAELKALQCPVLSLAGGADPLLPVEIMKKTWPDFDLHISENGGHALPLTDTKWCAERIEAFCHEL